MAEKKERDKYALKGLEGYLKFWNVDDKYGVLVQTVPDKKRNDGTPYEHRLYLADAKYADIPESSLVNGQKFSFDTEGEPDPTSKSGKRTKAINLKLPSKSEDKKDEQMAKSPHLKVGFTLTPISANLLEIFPNHPDGKAVNFTVRAVGNGADASKFKGLGAQSSKESKTVISLAAAGKPVELEVKYPGDSLDLMVRCDDLGTKDYVTLWKDF